MVGVALGVSLVAYGNRWAETGELDEAGLSAIALRHVTRLRFLVGGDNLVLLAETPRIWYRALERLGSRSLRLTIDPRPRDLDEVVHHGIGAAPLWAPFTYGSERDMIWHVAQRRVAGVGFEFDLLGTTAPPDQRPEAGDVEQARIELTRALVEAGDVAAERGDDEWASRFERALSAMEDPGAMEEDGNRGLLPVGYATVEHRQLLAAAAYAYVFGDGGWCEWEGNENSSRRELARVALNLYVATTNAIQAAVNV